MREDAGLFETLLGDRWPNVAPAVRAMHGGEPNRIARGRARVEGGDSIAARLVRSMLRMPAPGADVPIEIEFWRDGTRETWSRRFPDAHLASHLQPSARHAGAFDERLGPVAMTFALQADGAFLVWDAKAIQVFGVAVPVAWFTRVHARCGEQDGRYRFDVSARLPLLGLLIAYSGWLAPVE